MVQGIAYAATVKEQIFNSTYIQGFKKKKPKQKGHASHVANKNTWIKIITTIKIIYEKELKIRIYQGYALDTGKGSTGEINVD